MPGASDTVPYKCNDLYGTVWLRGKVCERVAGDVGWVLALVGGEALDGRPPVSEVGDGLAGQGGADGGAVRHVEGAGDGVGGDVVDAR